MIPVFPGGCKRVATAWNCRRSRKCAWGFKGSRNGHASRLPSLSVHRRSSRSHATRGTGCPPNGVDWRDDSGPGPTLHLQNLRMIARLGIIVVGLHFPLRSAIANPSFAVNAQKVQRKMLPSNLPILKEMLSDRRYGEFALELDELLRSDPNYTARKGSRILEGAARGERILRFEDRYVISTCLPPVPSRAFVTFLTGGIDPDSLFTDLAYARRSAPLSVHLCVTPRCPYRCEHCGATLPEHPRNH